MQHLPIMTTPFSRVAIDIVGPLNPASSGGHRFILTLVDCATRFPEAIPLKNIDSMSVAEALIEIFARVGIPREVLSDRGKQFTSALMGDVHKLLSIKPLFTSPYHPQTNGTCERMNGILKSVLKKLCKDHRTEWHRFIPAALFAIREIPNDSLKFSPFELLYGRKVRGPLMLLQELWSNDNLDESLRNAYQYVFDLRNRLEETAKLAEQNCKISRSKYKSYYDRKAYDKKLNVGDEVLLMLPTSANKLLMQWKGPYVVKSRKGPVDYVIEINGNLKLFHANMIKLYIRRATNDLPSTPDEVPFDHHENQGHRISVVQVSVIEDDDDNEQGLTTINHSTNDVPNINPKLDNPRIKQLEALGQKFQDVLTGIPGCAIDFNHKIELTTTEPIRKMPYRVPLHLREVFDNEVKTLLSLKIIEPSSSPYCSPVVLIKKKDASYRLCVDFRALNEIVLFDSEPMPTVEEEIYKFTGAKYFSELDLCKAYYQVALDEKSKPFTAFPTNLGLMQFTRLPFGLSTAGSTFIKLMRIVLQGLPNVTCYFDNIYVFSKDWTTHLVLLENLLERLRQWGLTVSPKKCSFGYERIDYLGFQIENGSIMPQEAHIKCILNMNLPTTKKQLRSFLGSLSFYRKFFCNFSSLVSPMTDMLKGKTKEPLIWTTDQRDSFGKAKCLLTSEPVLKLPDLNKEFHLQTDASDIGLGAVLKQYFDEDVHPVAYASRKLLDREKNYATIEKECLAIVWATEKFRMYLYGKEFIIECDHRPLSYIQRMKASNARIMRWALTLQSYKFHISYIRGSENKDADMLSR